MKKIITLTFFLAVIAMSNMVSAQWSQIGYMVVNGTDTVPDCHGFKGFGTNVYCPTDSGLFLSSDNGNSWQNITDGKPAVNGQRMNSVFVAANGDMYAGSTRRLFKSTDNGGSWTWLNSLPDSTLFYDIAESGGNIIASYNKGAVNGVYYSSNAGSSWTAATGITSSARFFLTEGGSVFVGGTANGVYKSTDNGQTWAVLGTGFPASAGIWSVKHNGNGYFANSVSGIGLYASYDNGSTWTNTNPAVFTGFCQVFSIAEAGNTIIASMDGACNGGIPIKVSTDTGMTWNSFMSGLPTGFYPNLGRNANGTSFFTKRGGPNGDRVYRYDLGPTGVAENTLSDIEFNLYPNPATGAFSVSVNQKKASALSLFIYDVLGKQIHLQAITNGISVVDTKEWTSGIYYYQLRSSNEVVRSGKVIVR